LNLHGKKVLIFGGAGFLGRALVKHFQTLNPKEIVVASRDEVKHAEMRKTFPDVTYYSCDVRDYQRVRRASYAVDIIIHAAAMKRVESCTFDPQEALKTNIQGSQNVVEAAIDNDVPVVIGVSSDKACNPANLYGCTKAAMEHLFQHSNSYNLGGVPRFSAVRYGNVLGSTGSVIPLFRAQRKHGILTVTDERMTRFMTPIEDAVGLICEAIEAPKPGLFYPKDIPAMKVIDIAKTVAPEAEIKIIGARPEEKLHEAMYQREDGSFYSSDNPARWYTPDELRAWMRSHYGGA
jgi:UDP-N-acetylglucosamine 4,6-dehydratase/5-epimerase